MKRKERLDYARKMSFGFELLTPGWAQVDSRCDVLSGVLRTRQVNQQCLCFIETTVSLPAGDSVYGISCAVGWTNNLRYDGSTDIPYVRPSGTLEYFLASDDAPEWKMKEFFVGIERLKRRGGVFSSLAIEGGGCLSENLRLLLNDLEVFGIPFLDRMCMARFGRSLL